MRDYEKNGINVHVDDGIANERRSLGMMLDDQGVEVKQTDAQLRGGSRRPGEFEKIATGSTIAYTDESAKRT